MAEDTAPSVGHATVQPVRWLVTINGDDGAPIEVATVRCANSAAEYERWSATHGYTVTPLVPLSALRSSEQRIATLEAALRPFQLTAGVSWLGTAGSLTERDFAAATTALRGAALGDGGDAGQHGEAVVRECPACDGTRMRWDACRLVCQTCGEVVVPRHNEGGPDAA